MANLVNRVLVLVKAGMLRLMAMLVLTSCLNNEDAVQDFSTAGLVLRPSQSVMMVNESVQFFAEGGVPAYLYSKNSVDGSMDLNTGVFVAPATPQIVQVSVIDSEGLLGTRNIQIIDQIEIAPISPIIIAGETLQLSATGGGGLYTYDITLGTGLVDSVTGLYMSEDFAGSAVVRVRDQYGYSASTIVTINPQISVTPDGGNFAVNTKVPLTVEGGQPPFTFSIISGGGSIDENGVLTISDREETMTLQIEDSLGFTIDVEFNTFLAKSIIAGDSHTCGLNSNGQVKCWGHAAYTGYGDYYWGSLPSEMGAGLQKIDLGTGRSIVSFSGFVGEGTQTHRGAACAVLDNGTYKCWGDNSYGQYGAGNTYKRTILGDALPAVNLGTSLTVASSAVSDTTVCHLFTNGQVKCTGLNSAGSLGSGGFGIRYGDNETGDGIPYVDLGLGAESVVKIAGGRSHFCAITNLGKLKCWGNNSNGQIGAELGINPGEVNGTMGAFLPFVNVQGGRTVADISLGNSHTCVLLSDGNIKCWGSNSRGQLGLGNTADVGRDPGSMAAAGDVNLGTGRTAVGIFAGGDTSCAILDNNTLKCWGANYSGNLGLGISTSSHIGDGPGEMGDSLPAINLGPSLIPISVSVSVRNTCALVRDVSDANKQKIKCWGSNSHAQLGHGTVSYDGNFVIGDSASEMGSNLPFVNLDGNEASQVYVTDLFACALYQSDNNLRCWGVRTDQSGFKGYQKGDDPGEVSTISPLVNLGTTERVMSISTFLYTTCAVFEDGQVKCWGNNNASQAGQLNTGDNFRLGDQAGEMGSNLNYVDLGVGVKAKAVYTGRDHTCALIDDDSLKCWGSNTYGRLGNGILNSTIGDTPGEMGAALQAVDFGVGVTVKKAALGDRTTCALLDTGDIKCFGDNDYGQLGLNEGNTLGDIGDASGEMGAALRKVELGTGRKAVDVASGQYHACAVLDNYRLKCWGANFNGQLGLEDADDRGNDANEMGDNLPYVDIGNDSLGNPEKVLNVYAGFNNTCVITFTGQLKCWGFDGYMNGILGQGNTYLRGRVFGDMGMNLPTINLGAGRKAISVSIGTNHMCASLDNGDVKCWGRNYDGRLGLGLLSFSSIGDAINEMGDFLPPVNF